MKDSKILEVDMDLLNQSGSLFSVLIEYGIYAMSFKVKELQKCGETFTRSEAVGNLAALIFGELTCGYITFSESAKIRRLCNDAYFTHSYLECVAKVKNNPYVTKIKSGLASEVNSVYKDTMCIYPPIRYLGSDNIHVLPKETSSDVFNGIKYDGLTNLVSPYVRKIAFINPNITHLLSNRIQSAYMNTIMAETCGYEDLGRDVSHELSGRINRDYMVMLCPKIIDTNFLADNLKAFSMSVCEADSSEEMMFRNKQYGSEKHTYSQLIEVIRLTSGIDLVAANETYGFKLGLIECVAKKETGIQFVKRMQKAITDLKLSDIVSSKKTDTKDRIISPRRILTRHEVWLQYLSGTKVLCRAKLSNSGDYLVLEPKDRDGAYYIFNGHIVNSEHVKLSENSYERLYHTDKNHKIVDEFLKS